MVRSRIEHAHAVVIAALRDLDLSDPHERRIFAACLVAARRLGDAREACDARGARDALGASEEVAAAETVLRAA